MTIGVRCRVLAGALALIASPALATTSADFDRAAAATKAALMVDPAIGLQRADEAERLAQLIGSARQRGAAVAAVERLRGEAYIQMQRTDKAAPLLAKALLLIRRSAPGTKVEAEILMSSGGVHAEQGDPAAAFSDYETAHHIFQAIGDARDEAVVLAQISNLYGDANDFVTALKYLDQAIAVNRDDLNLSLSIYNNRAGNLRELGRFSDAEVGYRKALLLARRMNSPLLQARILGNIARVRLKIGDVTGAEKMLGGALALAHGDDAVSARLQLTAIDAQAAFQRHDYHRAAQLIEKRFEGVDLATTTIQFREAHQTAYDIYRALGDAPRAVAHLAALKRLDDQATRLATSANSALAAARFDFANQELRLATLQRDDANRKAQYERQRAHTQRLVFFGVSVATAIIIALLTVWLATVRRSRNRVKAAADDLAITNTALAKALAAKTEFLATTSHEIRTPLNGILGMTQVMLADTRLAADTRERIGVVHGAGVTMRALVDDILDVAKMESGRLTVERVPFDLAATLTEGTRMWAEQACAKGVAFDVDLDACPRWIEGDAARLRQIAFNLLSNALKFTAEGKVSLRVTHDADRYRLAITDTGIGIDADKFEDIFESFKQADAGTTRQFGGTGLGLAICRNLVEAMDGTIAVESVVGAGSTFTVMLPLATVDRAFDPIGGDMAAPMSHAGVVVIDANPITRAMLKTLVTAQRADTLVAGSVDEATAAVRDAELVLIDQSALADDSAFAALCAVTTAPIVILWKGEPPAAIAAAASVIAKPVGGAALIRQLFEPQAEGSSASPLEQRAA